MDVSIWKLMLVAVFIGFPTGGFGIGGFLLPSSLIILFYILPATAVSSSVIAFIPGTIVAAWSRWKRGHVRIGPALIIGVMSLIGSPLGVLLHTVLSADSVQRILGILLLGFGSRMIWDHMRSHHQDDASDRRKHIYLGPGRTGLQYAGLGMVAGVLTGLTGIGGPVITVPSLLALGMSAHVSIGTSLLAAIFPLAGSSFSYIIHGVADWYIVAVSLTGVTFGMLVGAYYGSRWPKQMAKRAIIGLTLGSGIWLCI